MSKTSIPPGFHPIRHDRLLQEEVHDSYKAKGKLPEPTVCPQCNAIFKDGRWLWGDVPEGAHRETCPACHRLHDSYPAGFVNLRGQFFDTHRAEIVSLVRHEEERAREKHPLQRIMALEDVSDGVLVTTTDIHLARAIGEAVHRAYQGALDFHYNPEENLLRVTWEH
ncbi:BCAM0308 family protein [Propionivibrio limicola]|uniref:BCAM0308 family protein n=1 Tax=Propionivibrio limicola TaxID=167645 RepID=UPI001291BD9F|nr:BCAM0308 family protein [Propionivibrio limicola]